MFTKAQLPRAGGDVLPGRTHLIVRTGLGTK
jgi:hypothetical protein